MSIERVKERHHANLMRLPNVIGVGIGERRGKRVIKIYVTKKVVAAELSSELIVPGVLDGFETDVEAVGRVMPNQSQ